MNKIKSCAQIVVGRCHDHATLSISAGADDGDYDRLCEALTEDQLHHVFADLELSQIRRFDLPGLQLLHFVLYDAFCRKHWLLDENGKYLPLRVMDLEC